MSQPVFATCSTADIASEYKLNLQWPLNPTGNKFSLKVLRNNFNKGGVTSSERYTQNLVQIVQLNPPQIKIPSRFSGILTVVCDDTNVNRVSLTLPDVILTNGFYLISYWECNGEIKEDKSFEADCSIDYKYPFKTEFPGFVTYMHSGTLTATPVK